MAEDNRFYFNAGESGYKDLQVTGFEGDDTLSFSANNDWCGSTETGFGATVSVDIKREDVKKLVAMLNEWLKS